MPIRIAPGTFRIFNGPEKQKYREAPDDRRRNAGREIHVPHVQIPVGGTRKNDQECFGF